MMSSYFFFFKNGVCFVCLLRVFILRNTFFCLCFPYVWRTKVKYFMFLSFLCGYPVFNLIVKGPNLYLILKRELCVFRDLYTRLCVYAYILFRTSFYTISLITIDKLWESLSSSYITNRFFVPIGCLKNHIYLYSVYIYIL